MKRGAVLAVVLLAVAVAGYLGYSRGARPVRAIEITMVEYRFDPAVVAVKPGESVRFRLINRGSLEHEFESHELKLAEVIVQPGETREVAWSAPATPGEFTFLCDIPGHEGMEGKIRIQP